MKKISVFLVDDSALVRQLTTELLAREPDIEILGTAPDPIAALQKLKTTGTPDVLLLDVEMPRMDGLEFLEVLRQTPETRGIPVLMFSSLTETGCDVTLRALERGAVDFVTKPKLDLRRGFDHLVEDLLFKLRAASQSKAPQPRTDPCPSLLGPSLHGPSLQRDRQATEAVSLIAFGSSTGGTEALREILGNLPANLPPIAIVQHMHDRFIGAFAKRLDAISPVHVKEAYDGEHLESGHAYLAPGNRHLEIQNRTGILCAHLSDSRPVNGHKPSVDVLFHSCSKTTGSRTVAAILTGMGNDGADGLLALRTAGAQTIAQNEASCVVFGMPKEAITAGGAISVLPLDCIAKQIQHLTAKY